MKELYRIIMLPSKENVELGSIVSRSNDDKLGIVNILTINDKNAKRDNHQRQELYMVSNNIKEGDLVIGTQRYKSNTVIGIIRSIITNDNKEQIPILDWGEDNIPTDDRYMKNAKKIIATTNKALDIPKIPEQIIQWFINIKND